jgi:LmeA-like phospholipid-binding
MRGSAVAVAIIVVVLLAADFGVRRYEEIQIAHSVQSSLDLRSEPDVSLHGFPFISELARGKISSATVLSSRIPEGSLTFSDVHLLLIDLSFSVRQLLKGNLHAVHALRGVGRAAVTEASINAFLSAHGVPFDLAFEGGQTIARLGPLSAPIDIDLTITDGTLHLSAGPLPAVSLPLPTVLQGLTYGTSHPAQGRLILNFRMAHPTLDLRQ